MSILVNKKGINGINKYLIDCDRIYCELLHDNIHNAQALYTKDFQKFIKSMKNYPAVLRLQYCYAIGVENNQNKAAKLYMKLNHMKHYPYLVRSILKLN